MIFFFVWLQQFLYFLNKEYVETDFYGYKCLSQNYCYEFQNCLSKSIQVLLKRIILISLPCLNNQSEVQFCVSTMCYSFAYARYYSNGVYLNLYMCFSGFGEGFGFHLFKIPVTENQPVDSTKQLIVLVQTVLLCFLF